MAELKEPKMFSLKEARIALPFVKKIVLDITEAQNKLNQLEQEIRLSQNLQERRQKMYYRKELLQQMVEFQKELDLVGCHLKNPECGMVGFYGKASNGRVVELCWKLGDPDISYWQEIGNNRLIPLEEFPSQEK